MPFYSKSADKRRNILWILQQETYTKDSGQYLMLNNALNKLTISEISGLRVFIEAKIRQSGGELDYMTIKPPTPAQ